jgi:predicted small lipoprotein YifL
MVRPNFWSRRLNRSRAHLLLRLAVLGALTLTLALGLAACGRKGPLDLPPGASGEYPEPNMPGMITRGSRAQATPIGGEDTANPGVDQNGQPVAPKGSGKRIPLDNLLN